MATGTPDDLVTPTPPEACALAIALPLSFEAFSADLAAWPAMDYARGMLRGAPADVAWRDTGTAVAAACRRLIELARGLGVTVIDEVRLGDLGKLLSRHSVVTLLAHWQGALFRADDLLMPPAEILEQIREHRTPTFAALTDTVGAGRLAAIAQADSARAPGELVALLNDVVDGPTALVPPSGQLPGVATVLDAPTVAAWNRSLLDEALAPAVRPGNRVELRDGLHTADVLASHVPDAFAGIIDLALCQSMVPARCVKAGHPRRRVIMHRRFVQPRTRLAVLEQVYKLLASAPRNYAATLTALYEVLAREVKPRG